MLVAGIFEGDEGIAAQLEDAVSGVGAEGQLLRYSVTANTGYLSPEGAYDGGVRADENGLPAVIFSNSANLLFEPRACAPHTFAAREGVVSEVPEPTLKVLRLAVFNEDILNQLSLPIAHENLAQLLRGDDLNTAQLGVRPGGIISPQKVAGVDRIDILRGEMSGGCGGLSVAQLGQISVGVTEDLTNGISEALAVSYEYDLRILKVHFCTPKRYFCTLKFRYNSRKSTPKKACGRQSQTTKKTVAGQSRIRQKGSCSEQIISDKIL